mmetsp:Transcript_60470/g.141629  ORF Transcript_60470/g.141629 Transcript_60470/m.141629 type:complete len:349 (+) Transcript_60470:343-1389(+)
MTNWQRPRLPRWLRTSDAGTAVWGCKGNLSEFLLEVMEMVAHLGSKVLASAFHLFVYFAEHRLHSLCRKKGSDSVALGDLSTDFEQAVDQLRYVQRPASVCIDHLEQIRSIRGEVQIVHQQLNLSVLNDKEEELLGNGDVFLDLVIREKGRIGTDVDAVHVTLLNVLKEMVRSSELLQQFACGTSNADRLACMLVSCNCLILFGRLHRNVNVNGQDHIEDSHRHQHVAENIAENKNVAIFLCQHVGQRLAVLVDTLTCEAAETCKHGIRQRPKVQLQLQSFDGFIASKHHSGKPGNHVYDREQQREGQDQSLNPGNQTFHHEPQVSHELQTEHLDDAHEADQSTKSKK